jgi:serine/threonine-protein kinase
MGTVRAAEARRGKATRPGRIIPPVRSQGLRLGIYSLGQEVGRGGMGTVYRARSEEDGPAGPAGSVVAVKVFHAHLAYVERAFERFEREAEIGMRIRHPNVVRTYEVGREQVDGPRGPAP